MHYVQHPIPEVHAPSAPLREAGPPLRAGGWVVAVGLLAWGLTAFYTVQPNEQAVVQRFGRMLPELRGPGLHVGLPIGLDRVRRLRLYELRRVHVGAPVGARLLGRDSVAVPEYLTGDRNLVRVSGVVQYRVEDPRAYLFAAVDVDAWLSATAAAMLGEAIASRQVDDVLTTARPQLQEVVRESVQRAATRLGLGVRIAGVTLDELAPPAEVTEAFRDVAAAREDRQKAINDAQGYANRILPQARGEADQRVSMALGDADSIVARARGEAEAFLLRWAQLPPDRVAEYRRLALETAESVFPKLRKVVLDEPSHRTLDVTWPIGSPSNSRQ